MFTVKHYQEGEIYIKSCLESAVSLRTSDSFKLRTKAPKDDNVFCLIDLVIENKGVDEVETIVVCFGDKVYISDRYGNTVLSQSPEEPETTGSIDQTKG